MDKASWVSWRTCGNTTQPSHTCFCSTATTPDGSHSQPTTSTLPAELAEFFLNLPAVFQVSRLSTRRRRRAAESDGPASWQQEIIHKADAATRRCSAGLMTPAAAAAVQAGLRGQSVTLQSNDRDRLWRVTRWHSRGPPP